MKQYVKSLEAEELCGHPVTAESKQIWNIQLNMAVELLEVCKRHNLGIWAVSGTMLGAVRHQGFIPWDDDMDFIMLRPDYDKLLKIAPQEIKSPYYFQSPYTEKGYYRGHSQLRYDGTAMILRDEMMYGTKFHQGIFIDIFVADCIPTDETALQYLLNAREQVFAYLQNRRYPLRSFSSFKNLKAMLKSPFTPGRKIFWSDHKLYSYIEDLHRANDFTTCHQNCSLMWGYLKRCVRENEWFEDTVLLPFENIEIPVPARYKEMLQREYGDYMKLVKGTSMHSNVIADVNRSYETYLPSKTEMLINIIKQSAKALFNKIR